MILYICVGSVLLVAFIILMLAMNILNKQRKNTTRIETATEEINKILDERKNLLISLEEIINKKTEVNQNNFKDFDNLSLSSFELDKKFKKITDTFSKIRSDYEVELDLPDFRDLMAKLKMNEEKNEASKKYYNNYAEKLNEQIDHFPASIVAKLTKTTKKDMYDISKFKALKNDIVFESKI